MISCIFMGFKREMKPWLLPVCIKIVRSPLEAGASRLLVELLLKPNGSE
jgi:hypothetical protein